MIDVYPAIDLLGGNCVRLYQGDYAQSTVYGADPMGQAQQFAEAGSPWIHIVDLDAAKTGEPINRAVISLVAAAVDVPVQTGGGVRSLDAAKALFDAGVTRVVVGTAALDNPSLVAQIAQVGRVAIGLDVRGREVAVRGWTEGSGRDIVDVAAEFVDSGVDAMVVTQISQDGTLAGPDIEGLRLALEETSLPVIASGGVGVAQHITQLDALETGGRRLDGVIVGRALYEGRFTIAEALEAAGERQ
jgi:phosphoribosylformimino-5-aminoimidazole carboxamide ribotide isomerase